MEDEQYKKLKRGILKLKEDNESLREEISILKKKGDKKNVAKKDELDEWFEEGEEAEEPEGEDPEED